MTDEKLQLAATLADVLEQENEALQRVDFVAAVALLPAKEAAIAALAAHADPIASPPPAPAAAAVGQRLMTLAADNRVLLERAIIVQTRIVSIIAKAARPPTPRSYGAQGQQGAAPRAAAMALSTSA